MQKKLLALAVAGVIAAPVAMANPTVYGNIGMSVDFVNGGQTSVYTVGAATDAIANGTTTVAGDTGGFYSSAANWGTYFQREQATDARLSYARAMKSLAQTLYRSDDSRDRVTSNNSFLGIKGSEKISDNLSAVYQWEFSINFDQQDTSNLSASDLQTTQSKRNTFAGLSHKQLGTVTLGLQDTPLKTSTGPIDVFGNTVADYRSIIGAMNGSIRAQNSVMYTSPTMGGMTLKALYGSGNEDGNGNGEYQTSSARLANGFANPHVTSASVAGVWGAVSVVGAWERNLQVGSVSDVVGANAATAGTPSMAPTFLAGSGLNAMFAIFPDVVVSSTNPGRHDWDMETSTVRLGTQLTFGGFKIGVAWERTEADIVSRNSGSSGLTSGTNGDSGGLNYSQTALGDNANEAGSASRKAIYVGASYKFGSTSVMAAYAKADDAKGINCWNCGTSNTVDAYQSNENGSKQITLGASYDFSKNTSVFAMYTKQDNDAFGVYGVAGGATGVAGVTPADVGQTVVATSIGTRIKF